jgi:hypothetical protein
LVLALLRLSVRTEITFMLASVPQPLFSTPVMWPWISAKTTVVQLSGF